MPGAFVSGDPHGSGRINDTYLVLRKAGPHELRYLLQRINPLVFEQPELVMQNIRCITRHLRRVLEKHGVPEAERRCLQVIPTTDGRLFSELGLRFLTDYLVGDVYFKAHKQTQNLARARVQFKLAESMLLQQEAMKRTVARISEKCGYD